MSDDRLRALAEEIAEYKRKKKYLECITSMERYERESTDKTTRAILLTAKSTCNMLLGNIDSAKEDISRIDTASLSPGEVIYIDLVRANILQDEGKLDEAERVLSAILNINDTYEEQNRELLYETLARKGFILSDRNQFDIALKFLNRSLEVVDNGNLHANILIYCGYCLQALGRLDEAERSLKRSLDEGSGDLASDAFYRLGAVYLQRHDFHRAINAFRNAEQKIDSGRIGLADVYLGLSEAFKECGDIENSDRYLAKAKTSLPVQ